MFLKIVLPTVLIHFCNSNLLFFDEKNNFPIDDESCGTRTTGFHPARSARIIGGETPPYLAYPWQAEIQLFSFKTERFEHHCGGTVIADKIIMTAAHCMQASIYEQICIRVKVYSHQKYFNRHVCRQNKYYKEF